MVSFTVASLVLKILSSYESLVIEDLQTNNKQRWNLGKRILKENNHSSLSELGHGELDSSINF